MAEFDVEVPSQETAWDRFLEASRPDIGYKQSSWWADFLATRGWGHFEVIVSDAKGILGGARVLTSSFAPGKCFYYLPEGPVLPAEDERAEQVFEAIMGFIDQERKQEPDVVSHLRFEPRWAQRPSFIHGCREAEGWLDPRRTLVVDLSLSETAILEQMKPKGRYNIRLARRKAVTVVEDMSPQGVADFLEIYNETFVRHGMRGHSTRYFQTLTARLAALDLGSIFFAEFEGIRLATALVVYSGDRATYKYGGSRQSHRNVMAPYLLHFEAMRRAKDRGHRWYDFYGIAPKDAPQHRWANFSAFKRKFGGCELSFVPALDHVFEPDAYQAYRHQE